MDKLKNTGKGKAPRFRFPTVYGKDAFTLRRLTGTELCLAYDVPVGQSKMWSNHKREVFTRQFLMPVKVASVLGRCVRRHLGRLPGSSQKRVRNQITMTNNKTIADKAFEENEDHESKRPQTGEITTTSGFSSTRHETVQAIHRMQVYVPAPGLDDTTTESAVKHCGCAHLSLEQLYSISVGRSPAHGSPSLCH
ncbi:hypothetical protein ACA910_003807 [Epithemia clementina (nom. ined.)]